jgi:Protein of unknown function (DUF742)
MDGPRLPDPRMIPRWQPPTQQPRDHPPDEPDSPTFTDRGEEAVVRPFFVTGGRTRPLHDGLRIETLVTAPPAALHAPLRFESRRIVELCQKPRSIAEVAVGLGVPLGVARVLVADLVTEGYVTCHDQDVLPIDVIERIRDRVRAL